MKIGGNTIGTPIKPEKNLVKATNLTEEEKAQARANIGVTADGAVLSEADKQEIAGMVDLSGYPTTGQVQGMINTAISNIPDYNGEVEDV